MKITFVLGFHPNQRMNKRMRFLKQNNDITLFFWEKEKYSAYGTDIAEVTVERIFLKLNEKNILDRILTSKKFEKIVEEGLDKNKPDCIYVQNLDLFLFVAKYCRDKNVKLIYEISDINRILIEKQNTLLNKVAHYYFDFLEKKYIKQVDLLCYTSPAFLKARYMNLVNSSKTVYLPNIPNLEYFKNYQENSFENFTVGFIGTVRYPEQMKILARATKEAGVKLLIAGGIFNGGYLGERVSLEEIKKINENTQFIDHFDYPQEISRLYSKINVSFAMYDKTLNNSKIALPNKLYESIECEVPILVSSDTLVGDIVEERKIGVAISSEDELIEVLKKMKSDLKFYNSFRQACKESKDLLDIDSYNKRFQEKINELSH